MKSTAKILALVLAICMLAGSFSFAATPSVSIVSPVENSIEKSDSLLVSVKVADKTKISVTVFEEKTVSLDKKDKPVLDKEGNKVLLSVDVKDFEEEDFEEIAQLYEDEEFVEEAIADPATYTAVGEAGYFTKTMKDLKPGLYRVQIDVLGKDDKVTESYSRFVVLQEKPAEETSGSAVKADSVDKADKTDSVKTETVKTQKTSLVQSVVKLIKSIVK